jgi:hypothetical protein
MKITLEIEFDHRRCNTCGSWWAIERSRNCGQCRCPRCAEGEIQLAYKREQAAVRSAAASKANVTRKLNRRS